jgi:hypothetical protein
VGAGRHHADRRGWFRCRGDPVDATILTAFNPSTETGQTPEEAAEAYTASRLAIDIYNAAERGYLAMLAARLKLDDALVAHLQQTVATAAGKAALPASRVDAAISQRTARGRRRCGSAAGHLLSQPVELQAQFGGRRFAAIDRYVRWIGADTHDGRRLGQSQAGFGLLGPPGSDVGQRLTGAQALPAVGFALRVLDGAHEAVGAFDEGAEAGGHVGSRGCGLLRQRLAARGSRGR